MTHLGCLDCGAVFEVEQVLAAPAEFDIDRDGLCCPFCESTLRDVSPPISTDMPAVFAEFIATLEL